LIIQNSNDDTHLQFFLFCCKKIKEISSRKSSINFTITTGELAGIRKVAIVVTSFPSEKQKSRKSEKTMRIQRQTKQTQRRREIVLEPPSFLSFGREREREKKRFSLISSQPSFSANESERVFFSLFPKKTLHMTNRRESDELDLVDQSAVGGNDRWVALLTIAILNENHLE
jgi:hypothetical protein